MSNISKPLVSKRGARATAADAEDAARGPKHIMGKKNKWRISEDSTGCLCVEVERNGKYEEATFDSTRGSWRGV